MAVEAGIVLQANVTLLTTRVDIDSGIPAWDEVRRERPANPEVAGAVTDVRIRDGHRGFDGRETHKG
jgi:hypothetical protein